MDLNTMSNVNSAKLSDAVGLSDSSKSFRSILSREGEELVAEYEKACSPSIPECAEKTLVRLIINVSLKQKVPSGPPVIPDHEFPALMEQLRKQLSAESLSTTDVTQAMSHGLESFHRKEYAQVCVKLNSILTKIRPINVSELLRLMTETLKAEEVLAGKDVVLFIGPSGAGKSTTIHFAAGSKMSGEKQSGLHHIGPADGQSAVGTENVVCSPYPRSETRFISAIPVTCHLDGDDPYLLIFCDTPGFEDTRGVEINIANGFGVARAVQKCRSVRPVLFLSKKGIGDRGDGVRSMIHTLMRFAPSIDNEINKFSYVFTKYAKQDAGDINATVQAIDNVNREEESSGKDKDLVFSALLHDMFKKTGGCEVRIVSAMTQEVKDTYLDSYVYVLPSGSVTGKLHYIEYDHRTKKNVNRPVTIANPQILQEELERRSSGWKDEFVKLRREEVEQIITENGDDRQWANGKENIEWQWTNAFILNPLEDSRQQFLEELARTEPIENPDEVFKVFVSPSSNTLLEKQLKLMKDRTVLAMKRFDFALADYTLSLLELLHAVLPGLGIDRAWKDACEEARQDVLKICNQHEATLSRCLLDGNELVGEDVDSFVEGMAHAADAEQQLSRHIPGLGGIRDVYATKLISLQESLRHRCLQISIVEVGDILPKRRLDKMQLVLTRCTAGASNSFSQVGRSCSSAGTRDEAIMVDIKLHEAYEAARRHFSNLLVAAQKQAKDLISADKITESVRELNRIDFMVSQSLANPELDGVRDSVIEEVTRRLENLACACESRLQHASLDKGDLNTISSQRTVLESAAENPGLRAFVKEDVLKSYSKRVDSAIHIFFHDINDKIVSIFDAQEDNGAFSMIEALICQMEGIRMLPGIASTTAETFFQTMEKLRGSIDRARRNAEDILARLLKGEGYANLDELADCIGSLKRAQWLMRFCSSEYVEAVGQIEKKLIAHTKRLQTQVLAINVGVAKNANVLLAYELLQQLVALSVLEHDVPEVGIVVNNTRDKFFESLHRTLDGILPEILLPLKEPHAKQVDYEKLSQALAYLLTCESIAEIMTKAKEIRLSILNFMEDYRAWVQRQLDISLHAINTARSAGNGNDEMELKAKVTTLLARLRELYLVQDKYPDICSIFPVNDMIETWCQEVVPLGYMPEFCEHLKDSVRRLSKRGQASELNNLMTIARMLIPLDRLFSAEFKFKPVWSAYEAALDNVVDQIKVEAETAIKDKDFQGLEEMLKNLSHGDSTSLLTYDKLRSKLSRTVQYFKDELEGQVATLQSDTDVAGAKELVPAVRDVVDKMVRLRSVKDVECYLEEDAAAMWRESLPRLEAVLGDHIEYFLGRIRVSTEAHDFLGAETRMKAVVQMGRIFEVNDGGLTKDKRTEIHEQISSARKTLFEAVDMIEKKYTEMSVKEYNLRPPKEVWTKLNAASQQHDKYLLAAKAIAESTRTKLRELLDSARTVPRDEAERILDVCKFALKTTPRGEGDTFEEELKGVEEALAKKNSGFVKQAQSLAQSDNMDISRMKTLLQECKVQGQEEACTIIRDTMRSLVRAHISRIVDAMKSEDWIGALRMMPQMYDYQRYYEGFAEDEVIQPIQRDLWKAFNASIASLESGLDDRSTDGSVLTRHFSVVKAFTEFRSECPETWKAFLRCSEDLETKLIRIHVKVGKYFRSITERFESAIHTKTVDSLKSISDRMKQLNVFFEMLKDYLKVRNVHPFESAETNQFADDIEAALAYEGSNRNSGNTICSILIRFVEELQANVCKPFQNDETTANAEQRNTFFKNLNEDIGLIEQVKIFDEHIPVEVIDVRSLWKECINLLRKELEKIALQMTQLLAKPEINVQAYKQLEQLYDILRSISDHVVNASEVTSAARACSQSFRQNIIGKVETVRKLVESETNPQKIAFALTKMKEVSAYFSAFEHEVDNNIEQLLTIYKKRPEGYDFIATLGVLLNEDATGMGERIISSHSVFADYERALRNEKTLRFGIEYVLENLEGDDLRREKLLQLYKDFDYMYWKLVSQYDRPKGSLRELVSNICSTAAAINESRTKKKKGKEPRPVEWSDFHKKIASQLIAQVFALWTLTRSARFINLGDAEATAAEAAVAAGDSNGNRTYLQPHAAQVISIFRLFKIDSNSGSPVLERHLVQIGTGEGKSITLAVTAIVLALLNYDVSCACYSEYLSVRDYEEFEPLFDSLGIKDSIHYGTFQQLCESVMNEHGLVRDLVVNAVMGHECSRSSRFRDSDRKRILLIDEVDVFFNKDFYGSPYPVQAQLSHPSVLVLTDYLWKNKGSFDLSLKIKGAAPFQECVEQFKDWAFLIEESVKCMLEDLRTFETAAYVVKDGRIGYVEQDGISFTTVRRYKTLFAYYQECERGTVTRAQLETYASILINSGIFSYAEMPHRFDCIMGVTGTLRALSMPENQIIQDVYKINKRTFTPSVYGSTQLRFAKDSLHDVQIVADEEYYIAIKNEIDRRMTGSRAGAQRAVLIFFENEDKLKMFRNSSQFASLKDCASLMTEGVSPSEKAGLVRRASTSGSITLLTRAFGRGTNFVCYDRVLESNGGVHVIQTFLSEAVSEEIQIIGRTARQGNQGSYSMVLLDADLEKFNITTDDISRMLSSAVRYDTLHEKRVQLFARQYPDNLKNIEFLRAEHVKTTAFVNDLITGNYKEAMASLRSWNAGPSERVNSRTLCLMDATGSMGGLLNKSKTAVMDMFTRAAQVLKEAKVDAGFQLQFAIFRNYDCTKEDILKASDWETKPENLSVFMSKVSASGGTHWEEAVEIALAHANNEARKVGITQVILIGDAAPNTKEQVKAGRARRSEAYWAASNFPTSTYYRDELIKLNEVHVPVHAFYVIPQAKKSFNEIATATCGDCAFLDVNSAQGSALLTNMVTKQILMNIGGERGGELTRIYDKMYLKSNLGGFSSSSSSSSSSNTSGRK